MGLLADAERSGLVQTDQARNIDFVGGPEKQGVGYKGEERSACGRRRVGSKACRGVIGLGGWWVARRERGEMVSG